MALTARYLADKSALGRFPHPKVTARLRPLLEEGLMATCAIIDLEVLYSARGLDEYEAVLEEREVLEDAPITPDVMREAIAVQHQLARAGKHRVPIPDLIIAAAAQISDLVVLHYDADFELISKVTGQAHEWVAERGTL